MIADLPQLGTMFLFVSESGKLLEAMHEVSEGRILIAGDEKVQMIGHEAVGMQREPVSGIGTGEAV